MLPKARTPTMGTASAAALKRPDESHRNFRSRTKNVSASGWRRSASFPLYLHRLQSLVTVAIERRRTPCLLRQGGQPNLKPKSFLIRLTKGAGRASWLIAKRKVAGSTATQLGAS